MKSMLINIVKAVAAVVMSFVTFWLVDLWSTIVITEFCDYRSWAFDHHAFMWTMIIVTNALLIRFYYGFIGKIFKKGE